MRRKSSNLMRLAVLGLATAGMMAQTTSPPAPTDAPHGKVLFERNEDPSVAQKTGPHAPAPSGPEVTDKERGALTFTAYDLDVHLAPSRSGIAVHAGFTITNSGSVPLTRIVLQLSSSLHWESFGFESAGHVTPLTFGEHAVDTDADHTGSASEAVVVLPHGLAPGASLTLSSFYAGEIQRSGQRLARIGAPPEQAENTDWDEIAADGTWLRGFGDALWYPTASVPVFLGDGAKLFQAVGETKRRQAKAKVHLRLSVEYVGEAPDAVFFCGDREQLSAVSEDKNLPVAESPGVATAEFSFPELGFRAPSLFVTDRAPTVTEGKLVAAVTEHYDAVPGYAAAAAMVQPLLAQWLGAGPLRVLNILDREGQPFEDDALLVAPMRAVQPSAHAASLVHSLSHAWFRSSHVWLDEGVAQLLSLLWVEQGEGREAAVARLEQEANALALAEPGAGTEPGAASETGQSLVDARDEVYYRGKAAAVLWMLRSIVGDEALEKAFQAYRVDKLDSDPAEFQRVLERSSKRDLNWFFDDWVYHDKGLPELSIASVTPRAIEDKSGKGTGGWLVAVEVRNEGGAAAEVPVTIRSGTLTSTERLRIQGRSTGSIRMVFQGIPEEVVVNDGSVPEVAAASHTERVVVH